MKIKVRFIIGELPEYLTLEKVYETINNEINSELCLYEILSDDGQSDFISLKDCPHLNGGDWEVIEE